MADAAATPEPKKKGGKKKLILMVVGALVLVGGGVTGGMFAAGMGLGGAKAAHEVEDPDAPKLVLREGQTKDPTVAHKTVGSFQPDPRRYKASYYTMEQAFTSNLRDSDGIAQLAIGVSTFYDQKVLDNFKDNEMPIRSAVLETLAGSDALALETPEGKKQLQGRLKDAINQTLAQKTGYGGIDDVYFTSFIIQ